MDGASQYHGRQAIRKRPSFKLKTKGKPTSSSKAKKGLKRFRKIVNIVLIARRLLLCGRPPQLTQKETILYFLDIPSANPLSAALGASGAPGAPGAPGTAAEPPRSPAVFQSLLDSSFNREQSIAALARGVLVVPPGGRTDDNIQQLVKTMQTFSKFSGYPQHVQRQICKRGWYAKFKATRILVRQGARSEVYYFFLSGVAISRAADSHDDPKESRRRQRAIFLRKGDTLGETELLKGCRREVTVITREPVEVLGLDKDDFLEIFRMVMGEGLEFLPFLKTVNVLSDFPLELLQAHYHACSMHSYRKGAIITRSNNDSDWIYVIKSGACHVYKGIRGRGSQLRQDHSRTSSVASDLTDREFVPSPQAFLPSIPPAVGLSASDLPKQAQDRGAARGSDLSASSERAPRRSSSDSQLPRLLPGGGNLVTQRQLSGSSTISRHSDDSEHSYQKRHRRLKHAKSGTFPGPGPPSSGPAPGLVSGDSHSDHLSISSNYTKLHGLSIGNVFGLQSLIYEDCPTLTLVSNGAECVMIAKQFLRDHLDPTTLNKLRTKVPFPSVPQQTQDKGPRWTNHKERVSKKSLKH